LSYRGSSKGRYGNQRRFTRVAFPAKKKYSAGFVNDDEKWWVNGGSSFEFKGEDLEHKYLSLNPYQANEVGYNGVFKQVGEEIIGLVSKDSARINKEEMADALLKQLKK